MAPLQSLVPNFVFVVPSNCVSFRPTELGPTPVFIPSQLEVPEPSSSLRQHPLTPATSR